MSAPWRSEGDRRRERAQQVCSEWNALYPVDTPVLYWPSTLAPPVEAVTRSRAWVLASDTPVVSLHRSDGKTGAACALNHVRPVARALPAGTPEPAFIIRRADGKMMGEHAFWLCDGPNDWMIPELADHDERTDYEILRCERVAVRTFAPEPVEDDEPAVTS